VFDRGALVFLQTSKWAIEMNIGGVDEFEHGLVCDCAILGFANTRNARAS
jgi:hypothetical protein